MASSWSSIIILVVLSGRALAFEALPVLAGNEAGLSALLPGHAHAPEAPLPPGDDSALRGVIDVNGVTSAAMIPGVPASWTFGFADPRTGRPVVRFEPEHEKQMHLIIVSRDLAHFSHVHPAFEAGDGRFHLDVNRPTDDPDNQDAARAIPAAGSYFLFSEIKPDGGPIQLVRFTLSASGAEALASLDVDAPDSGVYRRFLDSQGRLGRSGDAYRAELRLSGTGSSTVMELTLSGWMDHGGRGMYMGLSDLEPWLGMPGHAVVVSAAGDRVEDKVFLHLHAEMGDAGRGGGHSGHDGHHMTAMSGPINPVLRFAFDEGAPAPGVYKVWFQAKRRGTVLTFPFTLRLGGS